jgi:hypothetical protein
MNIFDDEPTGPPPERTKDRRTDIPVGVKVWVTAQQKGMCACRDKQRFKFEPCGKALIEDNDRVHFNHDPPLGLRTWDPDAGDYTVPQNDPDYIFAVRHACHLRMTNGETGGGGRGTDIGEIARSKRIEKKRREEAIEKKRRDEEARRAALSAFAAKRASMLPASGSGAPVREIDAPPRTGDKTSSFPKGRGFQTGRSGPFKAKVGGGVVRRRDRLAKPLKEESE